jgi:hypothetical protein
MTMLCIPGEGMVFSYTGNINLSIFRKNLMDEEKASYG